MKYLKEKSYTLFYKTTVSVTLLLAYSVGAASQEIDARVKVTAYVGVVHPIVTYASGDFTPNFKDRYVVGMPTGINIRRDGHLGFSLEMVPYISVQHGKSRMSNFLFHPGALFPLGKGFTFIGRAAFETSGRFGFTPVLSKVITKGHSGNLFLAVPVPIRFGNEHTASVTAAFQFGFIF
ncbi:MULTISPECIES: hypothetical protein [Olivibacter]|uniref:Outer membrane protein beta-barrel domain-containing protein n=1 Tax=Olivibacter jilunii TaxID=985016 RepID=A0ABW6B754_9SPHI|nr:hypothetical protein [Pseudosphingobacterium sp.]